MHDSSSELFNFSYISEVRFTVSVTIVTSNIYLHFGPIIDNFSRNKPIVSISVIKRFSENPPMLLAAVSGTIDHRVSAYR